MSYKFKILSIDGGGIRGILPATILAEIEKRTGLRVFEMFDLMAGTSTGGMLALGLAKPNPNNPTEAEYTAKDLVEFYKKHGKTIFQKQRLVEVRRKFLQPILTQMQKLSGEPIGDIEDLFDPKYIAQGREDVLDKLLGEMPLEKALKEVFITSYDTVLRLPVFFTSKDKLPWYGENYRKICKGFTMKQAAMATSAAPTYFPSFLLPTEADSNANGSYCLVDGAVFANNPTSLAIMEAIIDAKKEGKTLNMDDILVVSLGTGSLTRKFPYEKTKRWGVLEWIEPIIQITLDGQSESVACQLEQLLPNANEKPKQYYRFQGSLDKANDNLDDPSPENIANLEELARRIIKERDKDLDQLCEQLMR
ncbi:patatin-like phospholipase family protein [Ancylothrix sp. C2]|uniref:patatin-like phospholipase family protein n=1 Tax=Ancylothrix sp. D3o TaxID=2953691 RepID=UPI0021BAA535|nr:patatin-like phospholipase family protein [Ancylothrix sp. D3o]MCT7952115.1 patatin-like phospholipase family protein [Ancylothrix sp. D3o]